MKEMNEFTRKYASCTHQSEGFPLTGYFVPACVGRWAWPGQKNCRHVVVVVAAVGVIFLSARFSKENYTKLLFCEEFKEWELFSEG